jgi:hypothetical protein
VRVFVIIVQFVGKSAGLLRVRERQGGFIKQQPVFQLQ